MLTYNKSWLKFQEIKFQGIMKRPSQNFRPNILSDINQYTTNTIIFVLSETHLALKYHWCRCSRYSRSTMIRRQNSLSMLHPLINIFRSHVPLFSKLFPSFFGRLSILFLLSRLILSRTILCATFVFMLDQFLYWLHYSSICGYLYFYTLFSFLSVPRYRFIFVHCRYFVARIGYEVATNNGIF